MDGEECCCCCPMILVVMEARSGKGFGGLQDQKGGPCWFEWGGIGTPGDDDTSVKVKWCGVGAVGRCLL